MARSQVLERVDEAGPRPHTVVIDLGATSDLDVTAAEMLRQLVVDLADRGTCLALARARGMLRDRLARTGLLDVIGMDRIHLSMAEAVEVEDVRLPTIDATSPEPSTLSDP